MVDLGREAEFPQAVNNHGEVVGYTFHADFTESAFSWTQTGGLVELPSLGGPQSDARAVNDDGVIVGASITAGGNAHATLWRSHDSTPPELHLPVGVDVPATGPGGATVTFQASATDAVDGSVPVSCTPASGSLLAIGDTRVGCTAADGSGNSASAGFTVHVQGAAEQLAALAGATAAVGPGSSLSHKVAAARAALGRGSLSATCGILGALHNVLKGDTLDTDVIRISAVLRC
jgi:probable HAF family extracellular repeat protein